MRFVSYLMKQQKISNHWGGLLQSVSQIAILIGLLNLIMISTLAFDKIRGFGIPFWAFMVALFVLLAISVICVHKWSTPSLFSYWNSQWYNHDNPIVEDIIEIKQMIGERNALDNISTIQSGHITINGIRFRGKISIELDIPQAGENNHAK